MFRHPLHSFLRLVMAVSLSAAAPALAADVTAVSFTVTIAGTQGASPDVSAIVRVEGTGLNNGTLELPSAPGAPIPLSSDGGDLVLGLAFSSVGELDSLFGPGDYLLSLNNGTVTATIAYEVRPAVPSPDISSPGPGEVIAPGTVQVLFTACAVCNLSLDSVVGQLEDGAASELANDTLTTVDTSWTPSNGMGGDLLLDEASAFLARISHTAVREKGVVANDDDNGFPFSSVFVQSDSVAFQTGFAPPVGAFCVAVNLPAPSDECAQLDDPTLSIFDPTGMVATTVNGLDVEYTLDVDSKGRITGTATADLDDDTTFETAAEVKGKVRGKGGEVKQKVAFRLQNEALAAKLKVSVKELVSILLDAVTGVQKASGSLGDVKVKEETATDASPLPVAAEGWQLDFEVDGGPTVSNATLRLEGGRTFPLTGSNKVDLVRDLSTLKLQTADKGIKIQLKKISIDEGATPKVTGGELGYKVLGQKGKVSLP